MTNKEKSERYATMCNRYGVTALLEMIRQYDRDENFEECQIILDGLNGMEFVNERTIMIPFKYDEIAKSELPKLLHFITGSDGIEVFNYLEKHIQVIKDYVK